MEATIAWNAFHALIRPVYQQPSAKGGRPRLPLEVMLRIHLQQWFTLSDPLMEEMLIDTPCFRRFAGIDMVSEPIRGETTILNFWHLLEEHGIGEQILEAVKQTLKVQATCSRKGLYTHPLPPRTRRVNGIRRCTRWQRETSGYS